MSKPIINCGHCGYIGTVPNIFDIDNGDGEVLIRNSSTDCPKCSNLAPIRDGLYLAGLDFEPEKSASQRIVHHTNDFSVYIDESSSSDGNVFIFGAVIVSKTIIYSLKQDIEAIRRQMGREMRRLKYPAMNLKKYRGELPEVHAQHMWQSTNMFQSEKSLGLLKRHRSWIEDVLKLIPKYRLSLRTVGNLNIEHLNKTLAASGESLISDTYGHLIPDDVSPKKYVRWNEIYLSDCSLNLCFLLIMKF